MPSTTSSCASKRSWVTKQFLQERPGASQSGWQTSIADVIVRSRVFFDAAALQPHRVR